MTARLGLVLLALVCFGSALLGVGDVDPVDLLAVGGALTAVAVVVSDRKIP